MIRWRNILQIAGYFILALAASMGLVVLFALFHDDDGFDSLVLATLIAVGVGGFLCLACRCSPRQISNREGILLVITPGLLPAWLGPYPFTSRPTSAISLTPFLSQSPGSPPPELPFWRTSKPCPGACFYGDP